MHCTGSSRLSLTACGYALLCLAATGLGAEPANPGEPGEPVALTGTAVIRPAEVVNPEIIGAGVNFAFSDYTYIDFVTGGEWTGIRSQHLPRPDDDAEWDRFMGLMDFSGFQYVRLCVGVTQWEPVNDNDDPHRLNLEDGFAFSPGFEAKHPETGANNRLYMDAMHRLLDHWEQRGLYVVLGNWWSGPGTFCPNGENWLLERGEDGEPLDFRERHRLSVVSLEEFTESLAAIMVHLKRERGYDCVKGISMWNEPEHVDNYYETLSAVYNSLAAQLERHGIRDRVRIQAFDGALFWNRESGGVTDGVSRLLGLAGDSIDIVSFHDYNGKLDHQRDEVFPNVHGTISDYTIDRIVRPALEQARRADGTPLPVVAGEFGSFAYTGPEGDTSKAEYRQRLHNAAATAEIFNHGAKAVAYWIYNNNYHAYWRMLTFDRGTAEHFVPDPTNYYPLALVMKYIPRGSSIVATDLSGFTDGRGLRRVYMTAAVNGAETTLLWVNAAQMPAEVTVTGLDPGIRFRQWQVTAGTHDRILRLPDWAGDSRQLELAPESITVLTTYTYGAETVDHGRENRSAVP